MNNLIITTGDISDADGFICLADYAKNTDADILFIMNYPAYFGVEYEKTHEPSTPFYEGFNYGLKEILKRDWNLEQTKINILDKIDKILSKINNSFLKIELTELKENLERYSPTKETIRNYITTFNEVIDKQTTLKQNLNDLITELTKYKLREKYMEILSRFDIINIDDEDNLRKFKIAYTKVAYYLVHTITQSNRDVIMNGGKKTIKKKIKGGTTSGVYFLEGEINDKNPFSVNSIKNELFVYADIIYHNLEAILIQQNIFDTFNFEKSYTKIYLDMCGSSIHNDLIFNFLTMNVSNIKGFFIMGGVLCDVEPFTIKLIKDVVHRPYFATMNQYYHSKNFIHLCNFLNNLGNIPFFVLPNHAILPDPDLMNFLRKEFKDCLFLIDLCSVYYDVFKGAKKPFDYMISRSVINFINGNLIVPQTPQSYMYVETQYGGTFLTDKSDLTSFNDLKKFKILKETSNSTDDNKLIKDMSGSLLQFPCHILSIDDVLNINKTKTISYLTHNTPIILDYRLLLTKYNSIIRITIGINGGFKPKIIKQIRKY